MLELLELLIQGLVVLFPPLSAVFLALGTALFAFCSGLFWAEGRAAGGVVFALLGLVCLALLVAGLAAGWFSRRRGRRKR